MKSLFEDHMKLTEKVLDFRLQRQNLVASNIANIDTPGYKARRLEFEKQLQNAMATDGSRAMSRTNGGHTPHIVDLANCEGEYKKNLDTRTVQGNDSVDLDKEMSIMAKNTLLYNAMTTVLKSNFEGLQTTIQEGSK